MDTTTEQITSTEAAEAVERGLARQCIYLQKQHTEQHDGYGSVWLAGHGAVIRVDHSARNICWSIRTAYSDDDALWGYGDRTAAVTDRIVRDAISIIGLN